MNLLVRCILMLLSSRVMPDAGLLGSVYLATFLISNVVTNNAAAALIFPIAMDAAEQTGTNRVIMSYCVMLSASASFMSPYGYTTNLLIYGPGGYKVRTDRSDLSSAPHFWLSLTFQFFLSYTDSTKTFYSSEHRCR